MENPPEKVTIEDFKRLEMRAATVVEVSRVPRTEKLFKVVVSLGEFGKKQTITGLVGHYTPEELMNKRIIFLCNLKEAKFAGQLSQGMLLAASEGEKLSLLALDRHVPDGARVS
jgi:methionine--tRNA ligase beta chain